MEMKPKRALITGITGQDGSYLAEFLLKKNYEVWGTLRRSSSFNTARIDPIFDKLKLVYADMTDANSINDAVFASQADEIYNLAGQSHVKTSFDLPAYTMNVNALGTLNILEAMRRIKRIPQTRFYQASSSEMFGNHTVPQNEYTRFTPCSPYGVSKLSAHQLVKNYRESYNLHLSSGILFNHESPRRGGTFVTKKIVNAVARIAAGQQHELWLGNLEARRDWGYAPEYVEAMWMMLQQNKPNDYVIATGETHTVREFCELAFGYIHENYKRWVKVDEKYYRPVDVEYLDGDASLAHLHLGWHSKTKFEDLVNLMMKAEIAEVFHMVPESTI